MKKIVGNRKPLSSSLILACVLIVLSGCGSTSPRDLVVRSRDEGVTSLPGSLVPPLATDEKERVRGCLVQIQHAPDLKTSLEMCPTQGVSDPAETYRADCLWPQRRDPENLEIQQFEIDFVLRRARCGWGKGPLYVDEHTIGEAMYIFAKSWLIAQRTGQPIRPPDPRFAAIARERVKAELPHFIEWGRSLPFRDPEHVKVLLAAYMRCEEPSDTSLSARRLTMPRIGRKYQMGTVTDGERDERASTVEEARQWKHRNACLTSVGLPANVNYLPLQDMGWLVIAEQATSPGPALTQ